MSKQWESTGDVIARFRKLPEKHSLIQSIYYDEDVLAAGHRFYNSEEFQAVLTLVSNYGHPDGQVLDLGGGNGVASLAWYFAGYQPVLGEPDFSDVVGTGAIQPVLETKRYPIHICAMLGEKLPFHDMSFDIVYGRQVLHHLSDLKACCREIHRILKPGGVFIGSREHVISSYDDLEVFLEKHLLHRYTGTEHAFLLEEYVEAIEDAGLEDLKILGSWQSVINYYPVTKAEFRERISANIIRKLGNIPGKFIAPVVSRIESVQAFFGKRWSAADKLPGHLNTFIARRGNT